MSDQRHFRPDDDQEVDTVPPPVLERRRQVNPQEAATPPKPSDKGSKKKKKKRKEKSHKPKRPPRPGMPSPQSETPVIRPPRSAASRLAIEESDDDDDDTRPMKPPQRKDTKGKLQNGKHPAEAKLPPSVSRSNSDASLNSAAIKPPSLSYQTTDPISNTTGRGGAQLKPPPPMPMPPLDQEFPSDRWESAYEESLSSRSNSIRSSATDGTLNTVDLVLAKRYAAYYGGNPTEAERAAEEAKVMAPQPLPSMRSANKNDIDNQLLRDEKRRQASGYVSQNLDQYTSPGKQATPRRSNGVRHPDNFEDEHDDDHSLEDNSLSTAPEPPSLQLRGHYMRPGAYRMRQGEEGRHVDNDSVASSSLRTLSTIRTNLGLGVIEASLVDDESYRKVRSKPSEETDLVDNTAIAPSVNGIAANATSFDDHPYVMVHNHSNESDDEDIEIPSAPSPPTYAVSGGGMTFATVSTASEIVEAEPFDEQNTIRAFFKRRRIRCMIIFLMFVFLCLAIGTIYAVTGFVFGKNESSVKNPTEGDDFFNSETPTSSPTTQGDLQLEYFVNVVLPDYTRNALKRASSPQSKALEWLLSNALLESYPLQRRLQRYALATLYYSTGAERRWIKNFGWLSDEDECEWFSMETEIPVCGENGFKVLSLSNNGLRGTLPLEISLLSSLELLQINQNVVTGFLPTTLGALEKLREVHVCKFDCAKGASLRNCPSRHSHRLLSFSFTVDNYISGTIPSQYGSLNALEVLDLGMPFRSFASNKPPRLAHLTLFSGCFPEYNFLAQMLPPQLGQLTNLKRLLLDRNSLVGPIPKDFGQLNKLEVLYMYENSISGELPTELGGMTSLNHLELDINFLSGTIPTEIGAWKQVLNLNLGNNTLSGTVPTEIGQLTQAEHLDLYANKLSGPLPSEIGLMTQLETIFLEVNAFTGRLPREIKNLQNLQELWLYSNKFEGVLGTVIGLLSQLVDLDVSDNKFDGMLPTELGQLTMLETINLSSNLFSGQVPSELGLLTNAEEILLHDNAFIGTMPAELCQLKSFGDLQVLSVNCSLVECDCCSCE
ncbi:MAG: hypothetical protein SGILL_003411 [Bacillariaceae sp.]